MAQGRFCTPALVLLVVWTARHVADASQLTHPHHAQALRSRPSAHDSSHLRRQSLKTVGTSTGFVLPATQCSAPMNASDLISVGVLQLNEDVGSYEFKQVLTLLGLGYSSEPNFAGTRRRDCWCRRRLPDRRFHRDRHTSGWKRVVCSLVCIACIVLRWRGLQQCLRFDGDRTLVV